MLRLVDDALSATLPPTRLAGPFAGPDDAFDALIRDLGDELAPVGVLETLLLAQLTQSAWRLRRSARVEADARPDDRAALRGWVLAERSFWKALAEFDKHRKGRLKGRPASASGPAAIPSAPAPAAPEARPPAPPEPWRRRLGFDVRRPTVAPTVRATGTSAAVLLAAMKRGTTWPHLLRRYPGLTIADLDACRLWYVAADRANHIRNAPTSPACC